MPSFVNSNLIKNLRQYKKIKACRAYQNMVQAFFFILKQYDNDLLYFTMKNTYEGLDIKIKRINVLEKVIHEQAMKLLDEK